MKLKLYAGMIIVVVLGLLVAVVSAQTATPSPARSMGMSDASNHLADVLNTARASDVAITFDFIIPLVTGERVWTVPDEAAKRTISAFGLDYVCFSEPWNDGSRERCTPFSNISSITFLK